jgi:aspartate/methionine/tyrosine aminotransferase
VRLSPRTVRQIDSPIGSAYALLEQRAGRRQLLDLAQAAPQYPTAPAVVEHVGSVARHPHGADYVEIAGLAHLRAAFAAELRHAYRGRVQPENVVITAGCNQAFCLVTSALAEPGDEIVLALPYYFNHDMWLRLDGVVPRYSAPDDDMQPSVERTAALVTDRTRAIVLVTPGNPTGVTVPPATIRAFAELARSQDLALIIDETYRNFRGTTEPPHDLFADPDWADTVVSLHSFSKDLAIPGHRVGAVVAGAGVIHEIMKLVDCVQISAPRIGQEAAATGLREARVWRAEQAERIERSLVRFRQVMAERPGGFELVTAGAFFGWVRHPFIGVPTGDVVERLVLDHDVLVIPGTAFTPGDERWIRFSYANLDEHELDRLGSRLAEIV